MPFEFGSLSQISLRQLGGARVTAKPSLAAVPRKVSADREVGGKMNLQSGEVWGRWMGRGMNKTVFSSLVRPCL